MYDMVFIQSLRQCLVSTQHMQQPQKIQNKAIYVLIFFFKKEQHQDQCSTS